MAFFVERCHEGRHRIDVASTETRRFTGFQRNELVPREESNPDLRITSALLYQLSYKGAADRPKPEARRVPDLERCRTREAR